MLGPICIAPEIVRNRVNQFIGKISLTTQIQGKHPEKLYKVKGIRVKNTALSLDKVYIMKRNIYISEGKCHFLIKIGDRNIGKLTIRFCQHIDENSSDEIILVENTDQRYFSKVGQAIEEFTARICPLVSGNNIIRLESFTNAVEFHSKMGFKKTGKIVNLTKMVLNLNQKSTGRIYDLLEAIQEEVSSESDEDDILSEDDEIVLHQLPVIGHQNRKKTVKSSCSVS